MTAPVPAPVAPVPAPAPAAGAPAPVAPPAPGAPIPVAGGEDDALIVAQNMNARYSIVEEPEGGGENDAQETEAVAAPAAPVAPVVAG